MMTISNEQTPTYQIALKDVQAKRKSVTGLLLSILAIVIFITRWETARENYYLDLVNALIILAGLIYNHLTGNISKKIPYRFFFFVTALGLGLLYPFNYLCIPFLLLAFVEGPFTRNQIVRFSNGFVTIQNWKKDVYPWNELQSAILKDGILTLDFRNNRILQREISPSTQINESDFNVWCAGRIHQAEFNDG